jgi:hypothetical protein
MMVRIIILFLILVNFVGCSLFQQTFRVSNPQFPGDISGMRFERTPERLMEEAIVESRLVTVRFASANFRDVMRQLTELTGHPISWDTSLDDETIDGVFIDKPLGDVLDFLSRRLNVDVTETQGMYFLGTIREGDFVSAVIRVPPVERRELQTTLSRMASGSATIIGSFI